MDKRVNPGLAPSLIAAMAAALPPAQHEHPDARVLLDGSASPNALPATLLTLVDALGLTPTEHAALAIALWVELDARIAAALALLQGNAARPGATRPTLGLVAALAATMVDPPPVNPLAELLHGAATASGLLQLGDPAQLLHARTLAVSPSLLPLLTGAQPMTPQHALPFGHLRLQALSRAPWPLPCGWADATGRWARALAELATPSALVLRGADVDELRAFAAQLAERLGCRAMEVQGNDESVQLAPDAFAMQAGREGIVPAWLLTRALPVWHAATAPGQTLRIPAVAHWNGPLVVLAGTEGAFDTSLAVHEFELPAPDADDRIALWRALREGSAHPADDHAAVARSRCGISVLARAASQASDDTPADMAIEQAVRASARGLSAWAQVSTDRIPADAWVGPPAVHRELTLLLTRCLARSDVGDALGPLLRGRLTPGVKALFIGASGTGKTLAAQWLADRLARPLVRVDLASVVSKYIGETEKNLSQLLARAEHLDAVLLFDEADSLFGARTDVKQANDRYANMQTNYLLQRLETFHGVAVLTSNSKARFDDAFLRRLDAVVEFPLPDVGERRALWSLHLGEVPSLDATLLNTVAALVDLPGGHIRNAVLTAALLARQRAQGSDGPCAMQAEDLREALALEYRKLGQRPPDSVGG